MNGMWTALLTGPSHLTQAKRIAFRYYCFCFELYVNSQTTYFFAWLYLYFGSGYQPKLVSEKNSIFSLTQFLHYAVFNVRALFLSLRCRFELLRFAELFYSTSSPFVCQALFSSFFDVRFGGEGLSFSLSLSVTAYLDYQTFPWLSSAFFLFCVFFFTIPCRPCW